MKIDKIKKSEQPGCVVGIGSSAGGLEALQQFLTFLPADTGMAFVVIQHLSPDHRSLLADILGKYTTMPVLEAQDGMHVRKNTVYMLPPKYNMEIEGGVLHLHEYNHQHINHPIDVFFRSLAKSYENRAVAMILSGTGSDGTNGIRSIKERNGMIIAQSPESAKFDGMPRSAIATGFVDLILNPDSIAREMAHISRSMADAGQRLLLSDSDLLSQVFSILKKVTNVNYSYYKQTTVLRRIERRIVVTHNRNLREYVNYMSNNPEEARLLAKEVLIGVTSFFRDQDYFDVLKERVVKDLLRNARPSDQIRIWVAGCSTGEEAYSIAILFVEAMEEMGIRRDIKIFATDLDADSIAVAGRGVYGDSIQEDVSVTRLSRFFTKKGNRYTVNHDIRKMIVFAQHNVFQDPPFGRLDLVSCRNLLIYFQSILQRNLFAIFHMALNDGGYLFLGRSESVIDYEDVFRVLCPNEKIFVHNSSGRTPSHEHITYSLQGIESQLMPPHFKGDNYDNDSHFPAGEMDTRVLELLMPACVLVNEKNELCHSYGKCGDFITIPVGNVTLDIFSLIREDLRIAVSKALKESRETRGRVAYDKIPVQIGDTPEYIALVAQPISDKIGADTGVTAIAFLRSSQEPDKPLDMEHYNIDTAAAQRIADLEKDLHVTQENLSHTVTELESVNAELQAANEELLTANEELQSSNEELQSVNEELYTVNSEYQAKVGELASVNDDMANFLATTMVGIVMVDRKLNVRKFTEYIADEFSVAEHDVGRSLRYIAYHFATVDLIALCHQVLQTMQPVELGCASVSGKTYLVRIAPYRTHEKKPMDIEQQEESVPGFRPVSGTGAGSMSEKAGSGIRPISASAGSGGIDLDSGAADRSDPSRKWRNEYVSGLVLTFIDTTQRIGDQEQIEEMAKALRAAVKSGQEKEAFLSHMSHDMRTPLTAIKGLAQLSLREEGMAEGTRDNMEKILSSTHYLTSLIDEVLETSRINAGKVVSVCTAVREQDVLSEAVAIVAQKAKASGLTLQTRIDGCENRMVMMDTEHVTRIIVNLLGNAIKFTPAGGRVWFEANVFYTDRHASHTYTIRDTGRGISDAFQQKMFMPFEQENGADNSLRDGTGLGLYICRNLIDLLGGTITCHSKIGRGSTFIVTLEYDLASPDQIRTQNRRSSTIEGRLLYGRNILVAEDNTLNAEVVMKILETRGVHAELARDGEEALEIFENSGPYHFQAILMDVMMPIMDGLETARAIRACSLQDAATIPIVALTADTDPANEQKCFDAGMSACLSKPIDTAQLFSTLYREIQKTQEMSEITEETDEV